MAWRKIEPGDKILMQARERDYLFYTEDADEGWEDILCRLHSIAYVDDAAVTVFNICDGTQTVRMQSYYESGNWYYLPLPEALR